MVGGDKAAFDRVLPVLQAIGPTVHHVGENGLAVSMKIATNLGLAVQMLALSEAVLLAEKSGIPREMALDVLMHSVIASPMVKYRGPFILEHPEGKAWFDCQMMQKEYVAGAGIRARTGCPLANNSNNQSIPDGGAWYGSRRLRFLDYV